MESIKLASGFFRRLTAADADAMAALERACFSLPWDGRQCRNAFDQPAFAAFGSWDARELLAYVSIYHVRPEMEILNVAVMPQERRKGIGRRIMHLVLQAAVKMGMQRATLEVREGNLAALALYKSLGFCQCGKRPHYYPDNGEDALIHVLYLNKD